MHLDMLAGPQRAARVLERYEWLEQNKISAKQQTAEQLLQAVAQHFCCAIYVDFGRGRLEQIAVPAHGEATCNVRLHYDQGRFKALCPHGRKHVDRYSAQRVTEKSTFRSLSRSV